MRSEVVVKALRRLTACVAAAGLTLTAGCAGAGTLGATENTVTIAMVSNSPPPIAVEAVILARAWFSDSVTKRSLISGFSASNQLESA